MGSQGAAAFDDRPDPMRPPASRSSTIDPIGATLIIVVTALIWVEADVVRLWIGSAFAILMIFNLIKTPAGSTLVSIKVGPSSAFFALAVLGVCLGSSPWAIGGVHPLWSFVGSGGGAVLDRQSTWIGLLLLLSLAFAFQTARCSGAQPRSARSLIWTLLWVGSGWGLLILGSGTFTALEGGKVPLAKALLLAPGARASLFGVMAIFALENLISILRRQRSPSAPFRVKVTPGLMLGLLPLLIGGLCMGVSAPLAASISALAAIGLFCALTGLAGAGRAPAWMMRGIAATFIILAVGAALLMLQQVQKPSLQLASLASHETSFQAAPFQGYGLGSPSALNALTMTRLNKAALTAYPEPANSYLIWALQGGLVTMIALLISISWAAGVSLLAALRPRPLAGLMRACACATIFLMVLGLNSAGPAAPGLEALWATLLGLGFGAAEAS